MRRWAFAWVLGLVACGGASRDEESGGGAGRCDQVALQATADRVEAALAAWRPGLGVPPDYRVGLDGLWDDAEVTRPFAAHCPEWAAVLESMPTFRGDERAGAMFRGCRFAELGMMKEVRVLAPYLLQPVVALPLFVDLVDPPAGTLRIEADRLTLECKGEVRTRTPGELAAAVAGCAPLRLAAAGETSWQRIAEVLEVLGPLGDDGVIADIEDPLPDLRVDVEMP